MTPKEFKEKARQGGFEGDIYDERYGGNEIIILDPKAWQAVAEVEKWSKETKIYFGDRHIYTQDTWTYNMHCMITALVNGNTLEQFLETL